MSRAPPTPSGSVAHDDEVNWNRPGAYTATVAPEIDAAAAAAALERAEAERRAKVAEELRWAREAIEGQSPRALRAVATTSLRGLRFVGGSAALEAAFAARWKGRASAAPTSSPRRSRR